MPCLSDGLTYKYRSRLLAVAVVVCGRSKRCGSSVLITFMSSRNTGNTDCCNALTRHSELGLTRTPSPPQGLWSRDRVFRSRDLVT
eukprot:917539-Rhodomonas_salina.2